MNESMSTELRELRARAYGPDADLQRDAAALVRLQELEQIARGRPVVVPARDGQQNPAAASREQQSSAFERTPVAASAAWHEAADRGLPDAASGATAVPGEAPATPSPRGQWGPRRVAVVLIASVVAAVVLTAAVTGVISRRVQADPREVAVLGEDPYASIPEMFGNWQCDGGECGPDDEVQGTVFTEFYGMSAFTVPGQFMGDQASASCLMLMESSEMDTDGNAFSGRIYNGCGAGEFPASIQVPVTRDLPAELRREFPEGSGLQFVLEGSEVIVLSDQP